MPPAASRIATTIARANVEPLLFPVCGRPRVPDTQRLMSAEQEPRAPAFAAADWSADIAIDCMDLYQKQQIPIALESVPASSICSSWCALKL